MQDPTDETQVDEQPEEEQSPEEDAATEKAAALPEEQETPAEDVAEASADEAPVDEAPVDEAPVDEGLVDEASDQAPAEETPADEAVSAEETAPEAVAASVDEASADEVSEEEGVATEPTVTEVETVPEGPSFGERVQETLALVRERLAHTFGPLAERLGETLAPLRERLGEVFAPIRERIGDNTWIYGVAALVVVVLIVALFIPPFSLLQRVGLTGFTRLDAKNDRIECENLSMNVDPATFTGKLRVRLKAVPHEKSIGFAHSKYRDASDRLLEEDAHLQIKCELYEIRTRGKSKQPVMIDLAIPNAAEPWETLDLYTWTGAAWEWVGSELHTENAEHEFIRATVTEIPDNLVVVQAGSTPQTISTSIGPGDDLATASGVVDEINPTGLMLGPDGSIIGNLAQQPDTTAYAVLPTLRNWAPDKPASRSLLCDVMENTASCQDNHITNIVEMCTAQGFAGVEIDYRGVVADERASYAAFIAALADALHAEEARLTVILPAPTNVGGTWDSGGYDWAAIGAVADAVKVVFPDDASAYGEGGQAQQLLNWATAQVPRYKLHMQVSSLSVEQRGTQTTYVSLEEALAPLGKIETVDGVTQVAPNDEVSFRLSGINSIRSIVPHDATGTYRIEYQGEGDTTYTVWLGTPASLAAKLQWAQRYHLGGVAISDLLDIGNAPHIANAVAAYRSATTPDPGEEVQVVWTVTSAAALIDQQTKPLNDPDLSYTWLVMAATDTYTVKAEIAGYEHGSMPVVVADAAPAPTPPPSPVVDTAPAAGCLKASFVSETVPDNAKFEKGESFVKSWTVQNSGTCDWPAGTALTKISSATGGPDSVSVGTVAVGETKEIQVELIAPEEDGSFRSDWALKAGGDQFFEVYAIIAVGEGGAPVVPVAPVASGGFELGGHVRDIGMPFADKMKYAGMQWAKVQVHYGQDASSIIRAAHDKNFKIQLSALGSPSMVTQAGFENDFAAWVAGMAGAGADAIEVWNEPNLDREWQAGYVDPAAYTRLLCASYSAIKAANPSTIVISAATAPTGYYGGCSGAGCDDIPYLQGMYNAGASQCMDYVGAHHNSGATSPSARSGHPADDGRNHHSWYFLPQTEKYYAIFGKQLFYTEMGYASQEGLATFSAGWAWARGVSNSQQAAWLAEAVQLSVNTGMVRCIIIWNMDFTRYGDDPQDGYAILRPGGSCPACDSLHNVLGSR